VSSLQHHMTQLLLLVPGTSHQALPTAILSDMMCTCAQCARDACRTGLLCLLCDHTAAVIRHSWLQTVLTACTAQA
jgi:hypothetical protein